MFGFKCGRGMLGPGDEAPEVQLFDLTGESWSLHRELKQQPVLLVFFKTSCPTCQFSLPYLQRIAGSRNGRGAARIILVSQDDAEGTRQFREQFHIDLPTVLDQPRVYPASNAFRITNVPSIFLIGQDGRIASAVNGFQKLEMEKLGQEFGVSPFLPGEFVPAMRPG